MTINDLLNTDCLDVDEILLKQVSKKKQREVVSMEDFLKSMKGGK